MDVVEFRLRNWVTSVAWIALFMGLALGSGGAAQHGAVRVAPADQWSQFRGNPQLMGMSAGKLPAKLSVVWTYDAGDSIESSAAIADGTVYVGSQSGELTALELATGKVRWKYQAKMGIGESSPCVAEGIVYVGDLAGVMHAVDARTGKGLWTFATEREIKSSPVLADGKLLFGSYDEHFYALEAKTGKLLWKVRTNGPVHSTAAIAEGLAYISGCDERFRGIRLSDGQVEFEIEAGAYTGASPALLSSPRRAYFGTFNNDVLGVDLARRSIAWRYEHPERKFPYYSSAAIADGKVVVGGRDKMVHALDAKTGKPLWTFLTGARVESSPAIADGKVYVGSSDGRFYVLDLNTGEKLWAFEAGAAFSASPAIAAGYVVIGSQDGMLYSFR